MAESLTVTGMGASLGESGANGGIGPRGARKPLWPTSENVMDVVRHALENGQAVSLEQSVSGMGDADLNIKITVRHHRGPSS